MTMTKTSKFAEKKLKKKRKKRKIRTNEKGRNFFLYDVILGRDDRV